MPFLRSHILAAALAWTLLVAAAAVLSVNASRKSMVEQARVAARVAFEKDLAFRHWSALRGGVYVRATPLNPPNPYLKVPDRDVTTTDGLELTLVNPAYMMRQVYAIQQSSDEVRGHMTSLAPIRPANIADAWERSALESFSGGGGESSEIGTINGKPFLRIMRPIFVESNCLKCHAEQGYRIGQIRGGISVAVPLAGHLRQFRIEMERTLSGYALVWAIGLSGILFGGRRLRRSMNREREARLAAQTARVRAEDAQNAAEGARVTAERERTLAEKARIAAEEANKAKGEFLANMSHEIRTPLNGMLGMLQLLDGESSPEEQKGYVRMAYDSGQRLLALLTDVLDFSRLESGGIRLRRDSFDVRTVIGDASSVFGAACREHGLELTTCVDESVPERLVGDAPRLRQLLFNLLANAVKFTPAGSVSLEVWARPTGNGSGRVRLYLHVRDTGIGLADDMIEHVFGQFTQADGSFSRKYQGAGLGLAIVKSIVERMDGTIAVLAEGESGTSIYVQVQMDLPKAADRETRTQPEPAAGHRSLRVLVAEDEDISRFAVEVMLRRLGHAVVSAKNGREAVELASRERFDVVLMDIQMPEMTGVEATHAIRAREQGDGLPRTRIIALTAHAMPGDRERFLAEGLDDHLPKPVRLADLERALAKARAAA